MRVTLFLWTVGTGMLLFQILVTWEYLRQIWKKEKREVNALLKAGAFRFNNPPQPRPWARRQPRVATLEEPGITPH